MTDSDRRLTPGSANDLTQPTDGLNPRTLSGLSDVPGVLCSYFRSVYGENLKAVFIYGSSLLRDVDTEVRELTREQFEDKRCDFILLMEDVGEALSRLADHWPNWSRKIADEMLEVSLSIGGRIVYFVPETVASFHVEFRAGDEPGQTQGSSVGGGAIDTVALGDYHLPYKFGMLGLAEFLRDLSPRRPHFYVAGRASKWSEQNLLYVADESLEERIRAGLCGLRRDIAEIARQLAPCRASEDEILYHYFLFSYLCEAWRLDFMSKPRSLVAGLGEDVRSKVREAIRQTKEVTSPDPTRRARILGVIIEGNKVSMRMSRGNSRTNRFSYSPNRMSGNLQYVVRKIGKIVPDLLLLPFRLPFLVVHIVCWRFGCHGLPRRSTRASKRS